MIFLPNFKKKTLVTLKFSPSFIKSSKVNSFQEYFYQKNRIMIRLVNFLLVYFYLTNNQCFRIESAFYLKIFYSQVHQTNNMNF